VSPGHPFRFRLERLRALRERREDLARQELAKANLRLTGSQARLRAVGDHLERIREEQRSAAGRASSVSAGELRDRQAFAEHIEAQRTDGAQEVARCAADVAIRTDEFGHAAREREMLERLKERRLAEHARDAARREVATLDDIGIDRFRRSVA
jgi:flagellar FliJ protein